jgi:hypothetical protein
MFWNWVMLVLWLCSLSMLSCLFGLLP